MRRCGVPFLVVPVLAIVLGLGALCTHASAQDPEWPGALVGAAALSDSGMAGVVAKGFETAAPARPGLAQPALQLWDEVRPFGRPALPEEGTVTITIAGSR